MRSGIWIALFVLLAAALGVYLFTGSGGQDDPTPADLPRPAGGKPLAAEPAVGAVSGDDAYVAGLPEIIRTDAFKPPEETVKVVDGHRVRVVKAENGEPVPGAVVGFLGMEAADPRTLLGGERGILDMEDHIDNFGTKFVADDKGETVIPPSQGDAIVCCQTAGRFALEQVKAPVPEIIILELEKVKIGQVQVVDAGGQPQPGIPVAVTLDMGMPGFSMVILKAKTAGENGMAYFREPKHAMRMMDTGLGARKRHLNVTLALPLAKPPIVVLSGIAFPKETIRLTLPPTGRVEVQVSEPADRPVEVRLYAARGAGFAMLDTDEFRALFNPSHRIAGTEGGRAVFEHVGFGVGLGLSVTDPQELLSTVKQSFEGPTEEKPVVTRNVALDQRRPTVVLKLLDEQGAPFAEQVVAVLKHPFGKALVTLGNLRFETDAAGCLRIPLNAEDASRVQGGDVVISTRLRNSTAMTLTERRGTVHVSGPFPPGDTVIGEVVMRALPVVATGTVVDEDDQPIAQVTVSAAAKEPNSGSELIGNANFPTLTDARGRFVVRAPFPPGTPLSVRARRKGYRGPEGNRASVEALAGAENLRLRLLATGGLVGSVILDDGIDPSEVKISVVEHEATTLPDQRGRFVLEELTPGTADVEVRISSQLDLIREIEITEPDGSKGHPPALLRITGILVVAGETREDPRLEGIDLRGRLKRFDIHVNDTRGEAIAGADVLYTRGTSQQIEGDVTDEEGDLSFVAPAGTIEMTVNMGGYQEKIVHLTPGRSTVTLEDGYRLHFTLDSGGPCPDRELDLMVRARSRDGKGDATDGFPSLGMNRPSLSFAAGWKQIIDVKRPGHYELTAFLMRKPEWKTVQINGIGPAVVEVTRTGTTEVVLRISQAELEEAVKKM